ncbi:hypothetical protein [Mycolicibacterium fortuitum]|uniref:hypothetical protein n=1 Tax=Mycolicibacterium fortuitum TaxID=1766 RepID=UPI0027E2235A|nr:hypothetical protein [Mycolicibacterium fortuitum]
MGGVGQQLGERPLVVLGAGRGGVALRPGLRGCGPGVHQAFDEFGAGRIEAFVGDCALKGAHRGVALCHRGVAVLVVGVGSAVAGQAVALAFAAELAGSQVLHEVSAHRVALLFTLAQSGGVGGQGFEALGVGACEVTGGVVEQFLGRGAGLLQGHRSDVSCVGHGIHQSSRDSRACATDRGITRGCDRTPATVAPA